MANVGYAAHKLLLGRYCLKFPLLRLDKEGKLLSISSFSEEQERINFIDGALVLKHRSFPEVEEGHIDIDLDKLLVLIGEQLSELELTPPI